MKALTPMMQQYLQIKEQAKDCILFFRLGDFYEMFDQDAIKASEILGITLTARNKGENKVDMCGVPFHSATNYIAKLTREGYKVAICEQVSDPKLPGIVKREIIKIITPGTTLDENILEDKRSNYLMTIAHDNSFQKLDLALALIEISTGEFLTIKIENEEDLNFQFLKYKPKEVIYNENLKDYLQKYQETFKDIYWHIEEKNITEEDIFKHFEDNINDYLNLSFAEKEAVNLALSFLADTQKTLIGKSSLKHLKKLSQNHNRTMILDDNTITNLEILENLKEKKLEGSLLYILDKTSTSCGGRLIKKMIIEPLNNIEEINERLNLIDHLIAHQKIILDLQQLLKGVLDIERIIGRLSLGSSNARDMRGLINSFERIRKIKNYLKENSDIFFNKIGIKINLVEDLFKLLNQAIVDEAPFSIKEGGMIKEGFDQKLDELKSITREGKNYIQSLQAREIQKTGINSLKVKFNRVFGYFIEISNANLAQVPSDYTRKQTLANAERFTTPELKDYEEKVLTAEEKLNELEYQIFEELRFKIIENTEDIKNTSKQIAYLDVINSLALVSWENRYIKPQISDGFDLKIEGGRHPVIEKLNVQDQFVPNDTELNNQQKLILITGPNMGGKSTYLRQNAIVVLMAHLGMYVPAKFAQIPLVDRIFTRVGASDNLVKGQSTFWIEMSETAAILKYATNKSLIILDEIGRGTSTFDGVSIAWGIMEYIHNEIQAKTLFASHYHELIKLADGLENASNYSVKVEEKDQDGVVFLYKINQGGINKSYGIEVAKLAGLPKQVIERSKEILRDLEREEIGIHSLEKNNTQSMMKFEQLNEREIQYSDRLHQNLEKIKELNLNNLTPIDALNFLNDIKKDVEN